MKTALIVINKVDDYFMTLLPRVMQEHGGYRMRFVTLAPEIQRLLAQKGMDAHCLNDGREEEMYDRFDGMERLCGDAMLRDMRVPGSELLVTHAVFWDRLSQWFNFQRTDYALDMAEALEFQLLVAPLDIDDTLSLSLMREARRRGIPSVGIKLGPLRTKENLDCFYCFDRVYVDHPADAEFLIMNGKAVEGSVTVIPDANRNALLRELARDPEAHAAEARKRLGLAPDRRIHAVFFSVRHAWEARRLLRSLAEARRAAAEGVRGATLVIHLEGSHETADFPVLFAKEIAELRPLISEMGHNPHDLILAAEAVFFFRYHSILEDAVRLGRRAILFDPHRFNRGHRMRLEDSGIEVQHGAGVDWSRLEAK